MSALTSLSKSLISGSWSRLKYKGSFIPAGRSSTSIALIRSFLYVFSGEHVPRKPVDGDLHVLDLETLEWKTEPKSNQSPQPCPRVGHAGTSVNGKFFIHGGRTAFESEATLSDLWSFDSSNRNWARISLPSDSSASSSSSSPSPALSYHTLTSSSTHLYAFGGCTDNHGRSNVIHSYSLLTNTWSSLTDGSTPNSPSARGGPGFAYLNGKLYCFGGYSGKEEQSDFYEFDLAVKKWKEIERASQTSVWPTARSVTDLVALPNLGCKGALAVFGGEYTPSAAGHEGAGVYHGDAYVYLVGEGIWTKVDEGKNENENPTARGWMNTVVGEDGKSLILYGGFDGKERLGDAYKLTFNES